MSGDWMAFLEAQGGTAIAPHAPGDPALLAAIGGNAFGALPDLTVLRASGGDTQSFLQGQLTCDVARVDDGASLLGAWCNAKGRGEVLFRLLPSAAGVDLVLPAAQLEATRRRLALYVLRADVRLEDASDTLVLMWATGDAAAAALAAETTLPGASHQVAGDDGLRITLLDGATTPAFLIVAGLEQAQSLYRTLAAVATALGPSAWELNRIRAGEPSVIETTAGAFVPQMFNLELLGGISFTKGCYIGQEVVARTQHLGKLKRRMYRARVSDGPAPSAGDAIYEPSGGGTQSAGQVVRAAPSPDGGFELLAVARIDAVERDELRLHQVLGAQLELLPLPYALDEAHADAG